MKPLHNADERNVSTQTLSAFTRGFYHEQLLRVSWSKSVIAIEKRGYFNGYRGKFLLDIHGRGGLLSISRLTPPRALIKKLSIFRASHCPNEIEIDI